MLTIKIPRPKDLQTLYARVTSDAEKNNISWAGDIHQGHITHRGFEGNFIVDDDYITIHVTKRPIWATNSMVEKEVKKYLSQ